jgi:Restriction endonuclease BglII
MELTRSFEDVFTDGIRERYEFREVRNGAAVLASTNPEAFADLEAALTGFTLEAADITEAGGNESRVAKKLNKAFRDKGWREGRFDLEIRSDLTLRPYAPQGEKKSTVHTIETKSEGYLIDNVLGRVVLDVEWNAKDGNLDRDVAAYRNLYELAIIDAAVMITRTQDDLRELGLKLGRTKFLNTTTTTNIFKLEARMARGDAGGCPMLAVAVTAKCCGV